MRDGDLPPAAGGALAGIVAYEPDLAALATLVGRVSPDVAEVIVFANSTLDAAAETRLREASGADNLTILGSGANIGLGHAYNAFLEHAEAREAAYLCLLDQDSLPGPGMISRLAGLYGRIREAGGRPAAVGPRPVGPDGVPLKIREATGHAKLAGATKVEFVISSGSLLDVATARSVGAFRADYFIDAIDIEWCMRANHLGFSIWLADEVVMEHMLGRGVIRLPFGIHLADQPPRRLYTFIRNQLSMMRLAHVPAAHKMRMAASLPARILIHLGRNRFSRECLSAVSRGLHDGVRNLLGPPDQTPDRTPPP